MSFDNLAPVRLEGSETETLIQENVLGNYFRLGLKPALGRFLSPEERDRKCGGRKLVLLGQPVQS